VADVTKPVESKGCSELLGRDGLTACLRLLSTPAQLAAVRPAYGTKVANRTRAGFGHDRNRPLNDRRI
jgi:hypothetical protein